jgi:hypothetical protein
MTNSEQLLLHLKTDGWCVLEGVIPAAEVESVRRRVEDTVASQRDPGASAAHRGIGHLPGIVSYDQSFAPYLADPRVMHLVRTLLGEHPRISFTTGTINYPGNERGGWHADWPFNQRNAGHIPAPYPDAVMHLTSLWMLSPFTAENGGTLVVPGSHRSPNNPTGDNGVNPMAPYPTELGVTGTAGSVLLLDSRLWHATAPNRAREPRVSVVVRYAPWWINLEILRPGSEERRRLVDETGAPENEVPSVPGQVFAELPSAVKPLLRHWVE